MDNNLQLLNNTEHRVKFKTGLDIDNVDDPIVGEVFLEDSKPSSIFLEATSITSGEYLDLNSNFQSLLSDSFALSMWVKLTDTSGTTLLFGAQNQANSDRFYAFHRGGAVSTFYNANGSSNSDGIALNNSSIDLTSWTHLLFTYQNRWTSSVKYNIIHNIYANGVNIGTVTKIDPTSDSSMATYGSVNSAANLFIGARNETNSTYGHATGLFDQIALFDLTESEVSGYLPLEFEQDLANSIWNNGVMTKINSLNPFGLWDMNNKSLKDKGSGANNATLKVRTTTGNTVNLTTYDGSFSTTDIPPNDNPTLYTCTSKDGTISKVSGNLKKMGDVPMLRTNSNEFIPNAVSPFSGGFSYSFWFYDDVTQETGEEILISNDVGSQNSYVVINYSLSLIEFRQHISRNNVTFHNDLIANYGDGNEINFKYEKNKLNHVLVTKEATDPLLTKFYFNGELVAECDPNVFFYPGNSGIQKINSTVLLIGDLAYWDTDISSISDEVYSPNEGHKGLQGDWRNLSIPPYHYWKLGFPMQDGQIKDIGTDGTNHLTSRQPLEETYSTSVYQNESYLFYPQDGVMHDLSNGESNPSAGSNMSYGHPTQFIINPNGTEAETVTWNSSNNRWEGSTRYMSLQVISSGKRWQIRQIINGAAQAFGNVFSGSGGSELSNSPADSTYSNGYSVADYNSHHYDPEIFMFTGDTINITRPDSSHPLHIKDSSGNDVASSVDQGDGTYKTTFSPTTAGTYQYYCTSHSSMIGNINVQQRAGYKNIFGIDRSTES